MVVRGATRESRHSRRVPQKFEGIYELPRAAHYLLASRDSQEAYSVGSRQLIRWIRSGLALPSLADVPGRSLLITFEDLVSMRVVAALRAAGVSWPKIRRAETWLRQATRHSRPFATEQLWTERSEVFAEFRDRLVAASRRGQSAMKMVEEYLIPIHGLRFDASHVAASWEPMSGVLLDPGIQFGAPVVKGTRVPTRAIWDMTEGGDSIEFVANAYRITADEVKQAMTWEDAVAA